MTVRPESRVCGRPVEASARLSCLLDPGYSPRPEVFMSRTCCMT